MKRSRRRFLKVVAAGAAAALVTPASALAQAAKRARPAPKSAPKPAPAASAALAREVAKQKASVARTLQTLREFPLANGAEPGFTFRPLRGARGGR